MTPTQLLDNHVPVQQDLTHVHRMVAPYFVVRHSLVLTRVLVLEETGSQFVFEGRKFVILVVFCESLARVGGRGSVVAYCGLSFIKSTFRLLPSVLSAP